MIGIIIIAIVAGLIAINNRENGNGETGLARYIESGGYSAMDDSPFWSNPKSNGRDGFLGGVSFVTGGSGTGNAADGGSGSTPSGTSESGSASNGSPIGRSTERVTK